MIGSDVAHGTASKIGLDCTIPFGNPNFADLHHFDRSSITILGDPPANLTPRSEIELTRDMEALIHCAPRTWKEILQNYHGQPYPIIYRAFSNLRCRLGRCNDSPWYRYTFSDTDFASAPVSPKASNFDPRHRQ
jgi:2,5-furandicarboxylate decarboxylase 1